MTRSLLLLSLIVAAPAGAQTAGASAGAGASVSSPGGAGASVGGSAGIGATGTARVGQPPAALGTTTTLGDRIDASAGLNSQRALGGTSLPGTPSRPTAATGGGIASSLAPGTSLDTAGRPAGTPLGTGVVTAGSATAGAGVGDPNDD